MASIPSSEPQASEADNAPEFETKFDLRLWQRFVTIAKPYWLGDAKWQAGGLLFGLLFLLLASTAFSVWLNQQLGESTSALAARDSGRFWRAISICVVILLFSVPVSALFYFVRDKLSLEWRRWLTHLFIESYFNNRAFYKLAGDEEIDNPDQRISDDIESFTRNSLYFLLIIMEQSLQLIAFAGVLWYISRELVFFLLMYAVVGTVVTTVLFGKALIGLNYFQLQREGDFRYRLVRIRENAESIALYRGEPLEVEQLKGAYERGYLNFGKLIGMQLRLNLFQYGYSSLTNILPAVIIAGHVLSGEMEVGRLVQATALAAILKAVSLIIDKFDALSKFAAGIDRLDTFASALKNQVGGRRRIRSSYWRAQEGNRPRTRNSDDARYETDVGEKRVVDAPAWHEPGDRGRQRRRQKFVIASHRRTMERGRRIHSTPKAEGYDVSVARSYMVAGTLREQLFYPQRDNPRILDEQLRDILTEVNLPDLPDRIGGFQAEVDWAKTLSLGEQQRIAFARVVLAQPHFVVLDEATSALDVENEERLYRLISQSGITMISISHRDTTLKYHQLVLELQESARWELHPIDRYARMAGPLPGTEPSAGSSDIRIVIPATAAHATQPPSGGTTTPGGNVERNS